MSHRCKHKLILKYKSTPDFKLPRGKDIINTSSTNTPTVLTEKTHYNLYLLDEVQSPMPVVMTGQHIGYLELNNTF